MIDRKRAKRTGSKALALPYMLMLNNSVVAPGDTIEIKGRRDWKFNHFTVHLFHGAKNFDKTGDFCNFLP